jgi:dihydrofolate reductase
MRKIIVSNLVTLDGFFEGPNRELDWFVTGEEFFQYVRELLDGVDTILFGKHTYQMMASYWPLASISENDPVIKEKMNCLPKVVFSKTLENVEWGKWNNARLVNENIPWEIKKMKQSPGKDMVIFGSGKLVSSLTQLGLIDEYRLIVNPVILGKGNPLFKGMKDRRSLHLIKTKTLGTGVVIHHYCLKLQVQNNTPHSLFSGEKDSIKQEGPPGFSWQ